MTCVPGRQYSFGRQLSCSSDIQRKEPSVGTEVATETRRSTAARSVTGASKVIEMGMATPTV